MIFDREYLKTTLSEALEDMWKEAEDTPPDFLPSFTEEEKKTAMERITGYSGRLSGQLNRFPRFKICFLKRKRWKKETEELLQEIILNEPLLGMEKTMSAAVIKEFEQETKVFLRRVRTFDKNLSIEDMGQALRNYIVYAIFLELNGLRQSCSPAIFGYSMLYPYTDNYIDDPSRTKEEKKRYNQLIYNKIMGLEQKAVSEYEEKTQRLLAAIEEDYKRPDAIYNGLLYMLEAQSDSQKQYAADKELTMEEILALSIYKGGLSVLIDRYFINKPFCEADEYFYYGFGFLLQLCDDLQDITQDKKEGSHTVFSVCKEKRETEKNINRLFHYTKRLFEAYPAQKEEFKQFLLRNCYYLILFSAAGSREHVTEEYLAWLEERMPVPSDGMESIRTDFAKDAEETERKLLRMLQTYITD